MHLALRSKPPRRPRAEPGSAAPLAVTTLLILHGCAVPVAPTGGPADTLPPAIVKMEPGNNSVSVSTDRVRIEFSEWVNEASFVSAFDMTPELDEPPEFDWGRRSVEIKFKSDLRENTTYILNVGTSFRDANGIALRDPITRAFSTGPEINRGRLGGRVVEPSGGQPVAGMSVFAYLRTDSILVRLPERPAYRTETGSEGNFSFEYLAPTEYYVLAVEDLNGNRKPDRAERYAPPPIPFILADTVGGAAQRRWVSTRIDTTRPEITRIVGLSDERLGVTFSEDVRLVRREVARWTVSDSASGAPVTVRDVYANVGDGRQIMVWTAPMASRTHSVSVDGVVDSTGNAAASVPVYFRPGSTPDTARTRFLGFIPDVSADSAAVGARLLRHQRPGILLSAPPDPALGLGFVAASDTSGNPVELSGNSTDGVNIFLDLDPPLSDGSVVDIRIRPDPGGTTDSVRTQRFEMIPLRELGGILGITGTGGVVVQVTGMALGPEPLESATGPSGQFSFTTLPAGVYGLRLFDDRNGNGSWDGGLISPYSPGEKVAWIPDTIRVRQRWETVIADTLKLETLSQ